MNVGGVTTNVPIGYKANKSAQSAGMDFSTHFNNAAKKGHTVYMKTDDMLYSGGNGTGLSFYIKYAESSTKENPTVVAKGVDENGEEFEQTIHINDINPTNATLVEMRALEAYLGVEKYAGFDSLPKVPFGAGQMGLHDRADFMTMFRKQISDMTLLRQQKAAEYYRYSMQAYEDFKGHMERKTENISFLDTISANLTEKTGAIRLEDMRESQTTKKDVGSATAEYKEKHPEQAGRVNGQIRAGQNVIRKFGAENVSREDMTMEEYKAFFTALMNSIPYDASQQGDVNVWSITEAGWEQMKNDPDYEAWVLGYTAQDRAVHNPFAAMPGYSSGFHTEHFGASIDEHIGQSMPMGASSRSRFDDGETWWEWKQKRMKALSQNLLMRSYFLN